MAQAAAEPPVIEEQGVITSVEDIKEEIVRVFGAEADDALCIAEHESGFRYTAKSPVNDDVYHSHDRGVYQLNSYWQRDVPDSEAYDARMNIAHAKRIHDEWGNWAAWSTRFECGLN